MGLSSCVTGAEGVAEGDGMLVLVLVLEGSARVFGEKKRRRKRVVMAVNGVRCMLDCVVDVGDGKYCFAGITMLKNK